jgi:riboflavin kinase/FMN adenylyltransferase
MQMPGGQSVALTFDKHPAELVAPAHSPRYLSSLSQRIEMISKYCPVDALLAIPFDLEFANLSAYDFVKTVLVDRLDAIRIFVGADFRYGKDRAGGVMDLQAAGETYHFGVDVVHSVAEHGERVSSTRVRSLIAGGDIRGSERLLGHPFAMRGTVVTGKRLGRALGFPTVNLQPEQNRQQLPSSGVYAGRVVLADARFGKSVWPSAISVGVNPTTDEPGEELKVEAYLMGGFDGDLYGSSIDIEFVDRLRSEEKFASLEALISQIRLDVKNAELVLKSPHNSVENV